VLLFLDFPLKKEGDVRSLSRCHDKAPGVHAARGDPFLAIRLTGNPPHPAPQYYLLIRLLANSRVCPIKPLEIPSIPAL